MKTSRRSIIATLACTIAALFATSASYAAEKASSIDPQALAILKRMSNTLSAARSFTYKSSNTKEVPASNGQFLTFFSTVEVALRRPDKLRVHVTGEGPHFDFYYDGITASASAPENNVYSTAKAPPTIDGMLPELENETGIRISSAPLLFSDPYKVLERGISSAILVSPATVHGVPCEHLAFRSPGVNWEIWIESASRALPRRLAVTYTDMPGFPRTLIEFTDWNLHPLFLRTKSFVFKAPTDGKEIPFQGVLKSEKP